MKSNKGFTLLELLAVIVVLAIIALIVTPFITDAITEAKEGAAKNTGYGIISAAELYYAQEMAGDGGVFNAVTMTFNPSAADDDDKIAEAYDTAEGTPAGFTFKGTLPESGTANIDSDGVVTFPPCSGSDNVQIKVNGFYLTYDSTTGVITTSTTAATCPAS